MKYLFRQYNHLGDMIICLPGCKLLADQGHQVWFECPEKYRTVFDAISYVRWAAPGTIEVDKVLECTMLNIYEASRVADIVYNRHSEIAAAKGQVPVFDIEVKCDYGLPEGYVLFAPFSYSIPVPSIPWILEKIKEIVGSLDQVYGLADRPIFWQRVPFITARELSHLPFLIKRAKAFITVNTGVDVIASGVRESYHHIKTEIAGGRCNYDAPNQIVIPENLETCMSLTLPIALLKKHLNPVFIESGTYDGGGVRVALDAGFPTIHSIEVDSERYRQCVARFKDEPRVHLHLGDTLEILPKLLATVNERATIWLDAHAIGAGDAKEYAGERWPLARELRVLSETLGRHDHTLLIDDRHDLPLFGMSDHDLLDAVKKINSGYSTSFENSTWTANDILVASLPKSEVNPVFTLMYQPGGLGSGPGSSPEYTSEYRKFIEEFIERHRIASVVDFGCGDWQFSSLVNWGGANYYGLDVVPDLIERLERKYGASNRKFLLVDSKEPSLPDADLVICKDVLQHLTNASVKRMLTRFTKYRHALLVNDKCPEATGNNGDIVEAGYRCLDLAASPFNLSGKYVFSFGAPWFKSAFWINRASG